MHTDNRRAVRSLWHLVESTDVTEHDEWWLGIVHRTLERSSEVLSLAGYRHLLATAEGQVSDAW